jgi:acyl carrier protein
MAQGVSPLAPEQGLQVLQFLLGQDIPQVGVLQVDWSVFSQHHRVEAAHPMLAEVVDQIKSLLTAMEISAADTDLLDQLKLAQPSERQEILVAHLQEQVRQILGLASSQLLDPHQGFFDMGMDSLMAVDFRNRLESSLNASLPATLIFEFSTIDELAAYLLIEVLAWESSDKKPQIDSQEIDMRLPQLPDLEMLYEARMESSIVKELTELETLLERNRHE